MAIQLTAHTTATLLITCRRPVSDEDWTLAGASDIVFMAKESADDPDSEAILTASKNESQITITGDLTLKVVIAGDSWPADVPDVMVWGLMARDGTGRIPLASGSAVVRRPIPAVAPVP